MVDVGTGILEIVPKTDDLASTLTSNISKIMGDVGAQAGGQLSTVAKTAEVGFTALGVSAVAAIGKGISATTEWAGEVRSLQSVTGLAAEDASGLAAAGNELGITTTSLNTGFGTLAKNIANGSTNLDKYGIATKDASGATLPFGDILANISDKYASLPSQVDKAAFAQNVFGKSGKALIPLLARGSEGLKEMTDRAADLGLVMSQDDLDAAKALTLAQRELGEAFRGASITIGKAFVPEATEVVRVITDIVSLLQKVPGPLLSQIVSFTALAGVLSVAGKALAFVKSGLAELPGAAGGAAAAQAEVASTATDAGEAIQTTASIEQASVAVKAEATAANTTLATSETLVGSSSAAAAGQLQLFDAAVYETTAAEAGMTVATDAAAGAFQVLNAPIVALVAPFYALYKGLIAAREEFEALKNLDGPGIFNAIAEGAKIVGINMGPKLDDPAQKFRETVDQLREGLAAGTITTDQAAAALDNLSRTDGIQISDTHKLAEEIAAQAGVTDDTAGATQTLSREEQRLADATGKAIQKAQEHSRALQEEHNALTAAAGGLLGLASAMQTERQDQIEVNRLQREGKTDTNAYREAVRQLIGDHISFRASLQEVIQQLHQGDITLGQAKQQLQNYGIQAGLTKQDVTNAMGLIKQSIDKIPDKKIIDVQVQTHGEQELARTASTLSGLKSQYHLTLTETIQKTYAGGGPGPGHAAGGIVMQKIATSAGPIGEGGPEAIIPLNRMGGASRQPVRIAGSLRIADWKQGLVDLDGELDWERLARTS